MHNCFLKLANWITFDSFQNALEKAGEIGEQPIKVLIRDLGASNASLLWIFLLIDLRYFLRLKHVAAINITLWASALPITFIFFNGFQGRAREMASLDGGLFDQAMRMSS